MSIWYQSCRGVEQLNHIAALHRIYVHEIIYVLLMPPCAELADASPARETLVLSQKEVTSEEARVDAAVNRALKRHGGRLESHWGPTLFHLEDLPFREDLSDLSTVFTPFKQKVSGACLGNLGR